MSLQFFIFEGNGYNPSSRPIHPGQTANEQGVKDYLRSKGCKCHDTPYLNITSSDSRQEILCNFWASKLKFRYGYVVKPKYLFQFNFIYLKGPNQTIKINLDYTRWKVHLHCIREDHTGLRGLNHRRKPTFSIGNNLKRLGIYLIPQGHAQVILRFGIILNIIYIINY